MMAVSDPVRKPGFFLRDGARLRCIECGQIIADIPEDWLDSHKGEVMACPGCDLASRIPTYEESNWGERKAYGDSQRGITPVDRTPVDPALVDPTEVLD